MNDELRGETKPQRNMILTASPHRYPTQNESPTPWYRQSPVAPILTQSEESPQSPQPAVFGHRVGDDGEWYTEGVEARERKELMETVTHRLMGRQWSAEQRMGEHSP